MGGSSSQFNSSTTAFDALNGADLSGRVAIVTGGNSGIGRETVKALSQARATVIIACRSTQRGETAKSEILTELERKDDDPSCPIHVIPLDLGDLDSVRAFPQKFDELGLALHYLVCNAGVFPDEFKTTVQGFEWNFGINHLGHFYLINVLMDRLIAHAPSRVVLISSQGRVSAAHGPNGDAFIDSRFAMGDDVIGPKEEDFGAIGAYGMGKLFNDLCAQELNRRFFASSQVMGLACRPGLTITTMSGSAPFPLGIIVNMIGWIVGKTASQGAATTIRCVVMGDDEVVPGGFYSDCVLEDSSLTSDGPPEESYAFKAWELSAKLLAKAGYEIS